LPARKALPPLWPETCSRMRSAESARLGGQTTAPPHLLPAGRSSCLVRAARCAAPGRRASYAPSGRRCENIATAAVPCVLLLIPYTQVYDAYVRIYIFVYLRSILE